MDLFVRCEDLSGLTDGLMSDICAGKACIITKDGRARAVLLDIDRYNAMVDALEAVDEQDLDSSRDLAKLCLAWRRELLR